MLLKVKPANSAVCSAQSTHLVSHRARQHLPMLLDPTGALVSVLCLPTRAHTQMLIARSRAGGALDLTGTNQSLQLPAEARYRLSITQTQLSKVLPWLYAISTRVYAVIIFIPTTTQCSQGNIYVKSPLNKRKKPSELGSFSVDCSAPFQHLTSARYLCRDYQNAWPLLHCFIVLHRTFTTDRMKRSWFFTVFFTRSC